MAKGRGKDWLPEERPNPRRSVLEDTLFRRLEDMRKKPTGDLYELVERTLEVLRATKEALMEQRRELRALASTVETLRQRIDQLGRTEPAHREEPLVETRWMPSEPVGPVEAELEAEIEPEPEPESSAEPEPVEHLLLLTTASGYRLRIEPGAPPASGTRLFYDDAAYIALRDAVSPFPGDTRRAILALPAAASAVDDDSAPAY